MEILKKNVQSKPVQSEETGRIREAENGWMNAKKSINDAIYELGKAYFEGNKDNTASEYAEQIENVNNKIKEEYIWHQYRLSLEGQRMCDSCKSFITSDSAFCNRCGAPVAPIDFSVVLGNANNSEAGAAPAQTAVCPKCGGKLSEGARFCETCGAKLY